MKTKCVCLVASIALACSTMPSGNDAGAGGSTGVGGGTAGAGGGTGNMQMVSGSITAATTWVKGTTYILNGTVYVDGATLTVEPGTMVRGNPGSAIVVTRTGKLVASGTVMEPIVFTVNLGAGQRATVDGTNWGGIVMNGKAHVNVPGGDNKAEGLPDEMRNRYGGGATPDETHDCGTLRYVRIEFAGQPLSANDELNGLTLNACGSGTTIDYLQIHRGIDDAIELFGGSVNIKHLVLTGMDDDGLDWDLGWNGKAQFLVIQQVPGRGNFGIEADNNRSANDAMPRSAPAIHNITVIGRRPDTAPSEGASRAATLRVGTAGQIGNAIFMNFTQDAIFVDGAASQAQWNMGALAIRNSIFFNNPNVGWQNVAPARLPDGGMPADSFDEDMALSVPALANRQTDPMLTAPVNITTPNFRPMAGSPALMGGANPPADAFFDSSATYIGAIGATDWTTGWTVYPEN